MGNPFDNLELENPFEFGDSISLQNLFHNITQLEQYMRDNVDKDPQELSSIVISRLEKILIEAKKAEINNDFVHDPYRGR